MKLTVTPLKDTTPTSDNITPVADFTFDIPPDNGALTIPEIGVPFFTLPLETPAQLNGEFIGEIAFDEPKIIQCQSVIYTLVTFINIVDNTVKQFEPCFL
ncbi:MAG: hypothetical protein WCA79_16265 [Anaerolineales bacterium]